MEINEELFNILKEKCDDNEIRNFYDVYRSIEKCIPQLNQKTKISWFTEKRSYIYVPDTRTTPILIGGDLVPRLGLVNAIKRAFASIYKYFIDHKIHEADRPKNWRPFDISFIGYEYTPKFPSYNVQARELEVRHLAWMINDFGNYRDMPSAYELGIIYAYDGLNDVLYLSDVYKRDRIGARPYNALSQIHGD